MSKFFSFNSSSSSPSPPPPVPLQIYFRLTDPDAQPPWINGNNNFILYSNTTQDIASGEHAIVTTGVDVWIPYLYQLRIKSLINGCEKEFFIESLEKQPISINHNKNDLKWIELDFLEHNFCYHNCNVDPNEPGLIKKKDIIAYVSVELIPQKIELINCTIPYPVSRPTKELKNEEMRVLIQDEFKEKMQKLKSEMKLEIEENYHQTNLNLLVSKNPYIFHRHKVLQDVIAMTKLHSWYKSTENFTGYVFPKKGKQIRSPYFQEETDKENVHWHISKYLDEEFRGSDTIKKIVLRYPISLDQNLTPSINSFDHMQLVKSILNTTEKVWNDIKHEKVETDII